MKENYIRNKNIFANTSFQSTEEKHENTIQVLTELLSKDYLSRPFESYEENVQDYLIVFKEKIYRNKDITKFLSLQEELLFDIFNKKIENDIISLELNKKNRELNLLVNIYKKIDKTISSYEEKIIGDCYCVGLDLEKNYEKAAKWYEISSEHGSSEAITELGTLAYWGVGLEQSYEEACKWYKIAADRNETMAQRHMGSMYYQGKGVKRDYDKAFKYYKLAAENGDIESHVNIGNMYVMGLMGEKDYESALYWFDKASKLQII